MLIAGVRAVGGVETQVVKPASVRPATNAGSNVDVSDKVTLTSSSRMRERQTAARLRELAVQVHANPQVARQLAHDYTYSNPDQLVGMDVRDLVVRMGSGSASHTEAVAELKAKAEAAAVAQAQAAAQSQAQQQVASADAASGIQPSKDAEGVDAVDGLKPDGGADMDKIIAMVDSQLSDMRGALGAGTAAAAATSGDAPALTTAVPQPAPSAPQPAPAPAPAPAPVAA